MNYYINDTLEETGSGTWSFYPNSADLFIGQDGNSANYFNGTIDDIRIYNRVLSKQEIDTLYYVASGLSIPVATAVNAMAVNPTGISEPYPNPSSNFINIDISVTSYITNASLVITDPVGNEVKSILIDPKLQSITFDISEFKSGLYFCHLLTNAGESSIKKIVIR
jgi:hypothetical protein